jgi:hypothetical protein
MSINEQRFELIENMKEKGEWPLWWIPSLELVEILEQLGKNLVGCEIGVCYGWNMHFMLEKLSIQKIYGIDPYEPYIDGPAGFVNEETLAEMKRQFKENTIKFNSVVFIEKKSDEAHVEIEDNSLDFVFIDGDHSYQQVLKDLRNYYPKVKPGGIFSGHDFCFDHDNDFPVRRALETFFGSTSNLKFCKNDSWYTWKN